MLLVLRDQPVGGVISEAVRVKGSRKAIEKHLLIL